MAVRKFIKSRSLLQTSSPSDVSLTNQGEKTLVQGYIFSYVTEKIDFFNQAFGVESLVVTKINDVVINSKLVISDIFVPSYSSSNFNRVDVGYLIYFYRGLYIRVELFYYYAGYSRFSMMRTFIKIGGSINSNFEFDDVYFDLPFNLKTSSLAFWNNAEVNNYETLRYDFLKNGVPNSVFYETDKSFWFSYDIGLKSPSNVNNVNIASTNMPLFHHEYDVLPDGSIDTNSFTVTVEGSFRLSTIAEGNYSTPLLNSTRPPISQIRFKKVGEKYVPINYDNEQRTINRYNTKTVDANARPIFYEMNKPFDGIKHQVYESMISVPVNAFGADTTTFKINFHGEEKQFIIFRWAVGELGIFRSDIREPWYFTALEWND